MCSAEVLGKVIIIILTNKQLTQVCNREATNTKFYDARIFLTHMIYISV